MGLGNPGRRYERTPHNVGFAVVDVLATRAAGRWRKRWRFRARTADVTIAGVPLVLVKPETFMNRSGSAAAGLLRYHKGAAGDLIVVVDDADLPVGRIRIRPRGSSGGHRGLASIADHVGSGDFPRVRIGIGRSGHQEELVSHVLHPLAGEAWRRMETVVAHAADAVECMVASGVETAMNRFNGSELGESGEYVSV